MALAIYPPARREQLLYAGVLDLTTHETYGSECHHPPRWALTSPFHPYSSKRVLKEPRQAVILCYATTPRIPQRGILGAFPLGSMVLCVARTFLSSRLLPLKQRQTGLPKRDFASILYYLSMLRDNYLFCLGQGLITQSHLLCHAIG